MTNCGICLFRFDTEADLLRVLHGGPWMVSGKYPSLLRQWKPGMKLDATSLQILTVWIKLPDLDLQFWTTNMLGKIASMIGNPFRIDKLMNDKVSLSYAPLMVEVDACYPLKDHIMLKGPDGQVRRQKIIYEFKPHHCTKCHMFGHLSGRCMSNIHHDRPSVIAPMHDAPIISSKASHATHMTMSVVIDNHPDVLPNSTAQRDLCLAISAMSVPSANSFCLG